MSETSGDILAWVDIETSGLRPVADHQIIEIATAITDAHLRVCNLGPSVIIKPDSDPQFWDPFVFEMHTKSGLIKSLDEGLSLAEAEQQCLDFFEKFSAAGLVPLAGSSIHFDKGYIEHYMPNLFEWFHYRVIDMSSFNECFLRWFPEIYAQRPQKRDFHRAQEDIIDSINGLRYYRERMMVSMGLRAGLW